MQTSPPPTTPTPLQNHLRSLLEDAKKFYGDLLVTLLKHCCNGVVNLKKQIAALEQSNIATKSWQLSGETSASVRPQNSLLEEVLQFDHTTAPG